MQHVLRRVPGLLILLGGLYTIWHFHQEIEKAKEQYEESHPLLKPLSGLVLAASGSMSFLMILGGIVAFIGFILVVKPFFIVTFFTFILAFCMMNWIGSALALIGSVMGFIYFCKNLKNHDEEIEEDGEYYRGEVNADG